MIPVGDDPFTVEAWINPTGPTGSTYAVETSTNFVNWTELADGVESEGEGETTSYTDSGIPADTTIRYYRVKEEE